MNIEGEANPDWKKEQECYLMLREAMTSKRSSASAREAYVFFFLYSIHLGHRERIMTKIIVF